MDDQISSQDAYATACSDMEDALGGIENLALTLGRVAQTLADADGGVIVLHLSESIRALVAELEETREYFSRLHHPDQDKAAA